MSASLPRSVAGRSDFIRLHTRLLPVPHAPEIQLLVADEATELWQKTEDELSEIGLPPPFWAFAWAGGQGLARYLLDHRDEVAGRSVLDFASGSGLVGIAAAMAGASPVICADIDDYALAAAALNAAANGVSLTTRGDDLIGADEGWQVVLAGDVFYQRDMAERILPWLLALARRGASVLVGDPGRSYVPRAALTPLATYTVAVTRALEDAEIKRCTVYRVLAD